MENKLKVSFLFFLTYINKKNLEKMKKSITPNLLTLLGFLCSTIAFVLTFVFDSQNKKYDYIYIYAGIFLFIYQTFDALDGKQARKTNTSSPLGQLFDHGCDSITTSFFVFIACKAAGFPKSLIYYILLAIVQIQGYMFSWMEYHTKVFNTSVGKIGTTESHVLVITMCILRGLKGAGVFQRTTLKDILPKSISSVLCKCVLSVTMNYVILIPVIFLIPIKSITEKQQYKNRINFIKDSRSVLSLCSSSL
ncbi:hypothetical protein PFNF135_01666 [Plasmodium falciparum NF135/5.C10]|uniref:CDP-alcohol phosphatidyltransferase n=1 Tax=Plasmodium falciparum NF135/5.C10 TaxID=1036726 RepID=W4IK81_PLAFA|nr:hypothetical protein PFNF135_01666 [Plasmodium falciparum NF135/5.C10]